MALLELEELIADKDFNPMTGIKEQFVSKKTATSHTLVQEIKQAEVAVSELENLVKQQDSSQYLIEKIQQAIKHKK
jgi:hypothetical protein